MLDEKIKIELDMRAKELAEEKRQECPDSDIEIVYVPVVVTSKGGHVGCISSDYKDIIKKLY